MTSILDSISSLFSPLNSRLGLQSMLEKCLLARTRNEENLLISDCLDEIEKKLKEPSINSSIITQCLTFVIFAKTLGYKTDFANIHAIKLVQRQSLKDKKTGYLACIFLLKGCDSLSLLLVNTIIRDLTNKNILVINMALSGACHLISNDQAPLIFPHIVEKLSHSNEMVRCKAIIALDHFLSEIPESCLHFSSRIISMLGDKNPLVVAQVINYMKKLAQISPNILTEIVPALIQIQRQILEDKFPKEYKYKQISSPWIQISILELLQIADCSNESSSEGALQVLKDSLNLYEKIEMELFIVIALRVQCFLAILNQKREEEEFLNKAIVYAMHLLRSDNSNFIYTGLELLEYLIKKYKINFTMDQQQKILELLDHPDHLMKRKVFVLLCSIANWQNAQIICNQLYEYTRDNCINNEYLIRQQIEQLLELINKFPDYNRYWHLALLVRILPISLPDQVTNKIHNLIMKNLLEENSPNVHFARLNIFKQLRRYSDSRTVPTAVLEIYAWTLSHFYSELELPGETTAAAAESAMDILADLGCKILCHSNDSEISEIPALLTKLVWGIGEIINNSGKFTSNAEKFIHQVQKSSMQYVHLRTTCEITLAKMASAQRLFRALHQSNSNCPLIEEGLDFTLSFLDDFVCESLERGEIPYRPPFSPQLSIISSNAVLESTSSMIVVPSSPHSSGRGSIEIHSPSDTCSFSGSGQIELVPAVLTWTKSGRIKEDSYPPPSHRVEESHNLSESTQQLADKIFTNLTEPPLRENPFDEETQFS